MIHCDYINLLRDIRKKGHKVVGGLEAKAIAEMKYMGSKMGLLQGYACRLGPLDGGPHGDRWSIYVTWPQIGGLRQKNVLYDNFRKA